MSCVLCQPKSPVRFRLKLCQNKQLRSGESAEQGAEEGDDRRTAWMDGDVREAR